MIENGADIHAKKDYSLLQCAQKGNLEMVKYLVENGADIHADNDAALRISTKKGHLDILTYLTEVGSKDQRARETAK